MLPKIVDEVVWVKITRGFAVPTLSEVQNWSRQRSRP